MNATSCYWSYIDFYTLTTYNYILIYTYFWHSRWSRIHKQPPVLLKFLQISQESTCLSSTKLQAFMPAALLKIDSYTGIFLWNLRNSEEHLFGRTTERLLPRIDYFIVYWFLQSTTVHVLHFSTSSLLRS